MIASFRLFNIKSHRLRRISFHLFRGRKTFIVHGFFILNCSDLIKMCKITREKFQAVILIHHESFQILGLNFPRRSTGASQPNPSLGRLFFYLFFLLSNFTGEQWFLLLFTFLGWEIFKIWPFSLHSRVLFFLFFAFYRVCVWGVA